MKRRKFLALSAFVPVIPSLLVAKKVVAQPESASEVVNGLLVHHFHDTAEQTTFLKSMFDAHAYWHFTGHNQWVDERYGVIEKVSGTTTTYIDFYGTVYFVDLGATIETTHNGSVRIRHKALSGIPLDWHWTPESYSDTVWRLAGETKALAPSAIVDFALHQTVPQAELPSWMWSMNSKPPHMYKKR